MSSCKRKFTCCSIWKGKPHCLPFTKTIQLKIWSINIYLQRLIGLVREGETTEFIQSSWRDVVPQTQGCALAEPGDPSRLTFVLRWLENLSFFIEIKCWAPWISQVHSTGLPSIFLRAQPWNNRHILWIFQIEWCGPFNFPYFISGNTWVCNQEVLQRWVIL